MSRAQITEYSVEISLMPRTDAATGGAWEEETARSRKIDCKEKKKRKKLWNLNIFSPYTSVLNMFVRGEKKLITAVGLLKLDVNIVCNKSSLLSAGSYVYQGHVLSLSISRTMTSIFLWIGAFEVLSVFLLQLQ